MKKNCLDTYALWEILRENPKYAKILNQPFVITEWTLAEFYKTLLREFEKTVAREWCNKLKPYAEVVSLSIVLEAINFQREHDKEDLSLFDCVGYMFSIKKGYMFVTGDKEFKNKKEVLFIQK